MGDKESSGMSNKRIEFMEKGFELFAKKGIETVAMQDVADAAGYGIATLYRYFDKKPGFVISVATWKWQQYMEEKIRPQMNTVMENLTAAEMFEYYLEAFVEMYQSHRDLLRFNQFLNIYIQSEKLDAEVVRPYREMIGDLAERFHVMYLKAQEDHTIRTDISEREMLSCTLHLMLAAVTRYAVGLVYTPENVFDGERELRYLKDLLLQDFRTGK